MKVYVVHNQPDGEREWGMGYYGDGNVFGVFTTPDKAKECQVEYSATDVDEFEVDEE